MKLHLLFEDISDTEREVILNANPNAVLTVYHGTPKFRLPLLINGFDATQVMSRDYGGPKHRGLFITPDFEVAKKFGGGAIIEIRVPAKFIHGTDYSGNIGRDQERERGKDVHEWIKEKFPNSFRPYMSYTMLSTGSEPQGLLIGVIKPSQITKVWIRDLSSNQWVQHERKEYLKKQDAYNGRTTLGRYEEDKFVDAGIDLSNPKMDLNDFANALMKTQGSGRETSNKESERLIKLLKFYGDLRGSEAVEEKLAQMEIGGSRLGKLARKNLVKQVMKLIENEETKKENVMRKFKLIKEGKVTTSHRFKKLAGLITEGSNPALLRQGVRLMDKWLSQGGEKKVADQLENILDDAAGNGYFFDKEDIIEPESDQWVDGIDLLEGFWDQILEMAPPDLAEALNEADEDVFDAMAVPLEKAAHDMFDDIAQEVINAHAESRAESAERDRDPYAYYGVNRSDFY